MGSEAGLVRGCYTCHRDLYRGGGARWPLALVRDVLLGKDGVGVETLRLVVDDDREVTWKLVKLAICERSPEAVRSGVLFAAARMCGVPGEVTVK